MATLERFVIEAGFNTKPFFKGIKDLNKKLLGIGKTSKKLSNSFSGMFKVAGIAGLTAMTLNAAKLGREMGLISRYTGISTENISKMQNAFAASGGDAKEVGQTLQRITQGLARLSMGDASFASRLSAMNINAWDEYGRVKDAEKIRLEMADWIQDQLKAGRSLAEVATFMGDNFQMSQAEVEQLSVGSKELLRIQEKTNKKTGYLRESERKSLEELEKKVKEFRASVSTSFDRLISEASEPLTGLLDGLEEILKFTQDHKDLFSPLLLGLAGLATALKALPVLFTAISAHPLVALALASIAAGYTAGGGFNKPDTLKKAAQKRFFSGEMSFEEYNDFILNKSGEYEKSTGGYRNKRTGIEVLNLSEQSFAKLPVYDEAGNPVDLSQVHDASSSKEVIVEIDYDTTFNMSDTSRAEDVLDAQMQNLNNMKDYFRQNLPRLADGGI